MNTHNDGAVLISRGRLFHASGAAMEKPRSPNLILVCGRTLINIATISGDDAYHAVYGGTTSATIRWCNGASPEVLRKKHLFPKGLLKKKKKILNDEMIQLEQK